jgi:glycosyltransferase involved in cell wall biosynthesis
MQRSRLKLVVVSPDLALGGAQRVLLQLAQRWVEAGCAVEFVALKGGGQLRDELPSGVNLTELVDEPGLHGPGLALSAFPRLVSHLRAARPDGVLSSVTGCNLLVCAAHLASGSAACLVLREATHAPAEGAFARRLLMRALYPRADALVAVSKGIAGELIRLGLAPASVHTVANPVDAERLQRLATSGEHVPTTIRARYLVAVGRLIPEKDYGCLLRAFAMSDLAATHDLVIVGGGKLLGELTALAEALGIGSRVHWLGALANPYAIMAAAELYVLSSRHEGYPNVLLEALALGVRVVATDCRSGPRQLLQDGRYGLLVPVADPAELAEAMRRALGGPAVDASTLLAEHSPQLIAARYLALFAT